MSCLPGPVLPKPGLPSEWIKRQRPQTITTILYFVALHQPHKTQPTARWSLGILSIILWGEDYPCATKSSLRFRCTTVSENYILIIISPEGGQDAPQQLIISPNPLHFTSTLIAWSQLGWTKQQSSQWVYSNQFYISTILQTKGWPVPDSQRVTWRISVRQKPATIFQNYNLFN